VHRDRGLIWYDESGSPQLALRGKQLASEEFFAYLQLRRNRIPYDADRLFCLSVRCSNENVPKFSFGSTGSPVPSAGSKLSSNRVTSVVAGTFSMRARARLSSAGISWIVQIPAFIASTPCPDEAIGADGDRN
jgi:hypothetical protein